ncbi:AGAP009862-PA-like protein [Anopheles sinensis]|uniref:AGAP009862-PA-like protein n=1 Tax=Anopheles sinensis TaxID=74873 RepID=A0A084W222_ANOSI|nr:AGAP009862-PA-like protein [Anopheles sinensis]
MIKIGRNIVHQLDNRERGFRTRRIRNCASAVANEHYFRRHAVELAELVLLERLKTEDLCKPIDDLASETESVFNIEQSHDGQVLLTATVQTNRCVNVFQTTSMYKLAKYPSRERSVWTLAFHPINANTIAFGTLGGTVLVYVDNRVVASLQEPEPIGSVCFHPTQNFLLLTSMNEVVFWDWVNGITHTAGMFSDCKCRFLHVTSDARLITGITQTQTHVLANVGGNVELVEPEYLVVSLLRSVTLMLDKLEQTMASQVDYLLQLEMSKQCLIWIYLLQTINRKRVGIRCCATVTDTNSCTKSDLNVTLLTLNRKIDALEETLRTRSSIPIIPNHTPSWSPVTVFLTEPMSFFQQICQKYICQRNRNYIQYNFDLNLVQEMLRKLHDMFYLLAPSDLPKTGDILGTLSGTSRKPENHCVLQAWDLELLKGDGEDLPDFKEDWKNVITTCMINNDSNVAISQCEQFIASIRLRSVKEMEIRSLRRENFGESLFLFKFTAEFVSLSFSPSGRYVAIGLRCRRNLKYAYIVDKESLWRIGVSSGTFDSISSRFDIVEQNERVGLKLSLPRDSQNYLEINCIKWAALPGYGLLVGLKSKFVRICR